MDLIDFPGRVILMERELNSSEDSHSDSRRVALDALFGVFGSYCRPLSFEILYSYWNDEFDFPVSIEGADPPAEMLAVSTSLPGLTRYPSYAEQITYLDGELSRTAVDKCLDGFESGFGRVEGSSLGWQTMEVGSCMAIIPGIGSGASEVRVQWNGIKFFLGAVSLGEQLWGYGPQDGFLSPPVGVRISRENGGLILELAQYWSVWFDGGAGEPFIREAISGLECNGWNRLR
ncbi:hypothetical protein [Nocardia lijiangensis]|uniref:hypothetical protein n=1 Tax=Nocardia lijiangensis TaxID=299618 RepID=UPI003D75C5AD